MGDFIVESELPTTAVIAPVAIGRRVRPMSSASAGFPLQARVSQLRTRTNDAQSIMLWRLSNVVLLASLFSSCFAWDFSAHRLFFVSILLAVPRLCHAIAKSPYLVKPMCFVWIINLVSTVHYVWFLDIPFNASWFWQLNLYPLALPYADYVVRYDLAAFGRQCFVFLVALYTLAFGIIAVFAFDHAISSLCSFEPNVAASYRLSHLLHTDFSLLKARSAWLVSCFTIVGLARKHRTRNRVSVVLAILYCWILRSKAALLPWLALSLVLVCIRFKQRILILFLIALLLCVVVFLNFDYLNSFFLEEGRYLAPVFVSPQFWMTPLGTGMGNYGNTMLSGFYGANRFGDDARSWYFPEWDICIGPDEMFPKPESDILLLAVSFGWLPCFACLAILSKELLVFLRDIRKKNDRQRAGFFLMVFVCISGISQDHFSSPCGWFFLAVSLALMYVEDCASKKQQPTTRYRLEGKRPVETQAQCTFKGI